MPPRGGVFTDLGLSEKELELTKEASELLMRYTYPGNVRELENVVERAVVLCRGPLVTSADLPFQLKEGPHEPEELPGLSNLPLPQQLEKMEKHWIEQALRETGGIQTRAAEKLGISERVLRYKLQKYGL